MRRSLCARRYQRALGRQLRSTRDVQRYGACFPVTAGRSYISDVGRPLHRLAGYLFISLLAVLSYFMLLRIKGWPDELSPRIVLHMALGFSLAPLLVVKVIAVRSRRASHALLCALGITIYAVAFTLVSINVAVHFLRNASVGKVPLWISLVFVFAVLLVAGLAFASKQKIRVL